MTLNFVLQRQAFGAPLFDKQAVRPAHAMFDAKVRDARILAIGGGATEVMLDEAAKRY